MSNPYEDIINNRTNYVADNMGSFKVDNIVFNGYGKYTFSWEQTLVKSPSRTNNGSMGDLNNQIATFATPHLIAVFDFMPIDLYRQMVKAIIGSKQVNGKDTLDTSLRKIEFVVECYDPIFDTTTKNKMYFATLPTPEYYCIANTDSDGNNVVELLGVRNYTVELIGTNNPVD